jgi:ankyrin repeat protein
MLILTKLGTLLLLSTVLADEAEISTQNLVLGGLASAAALAGAGTAIHLRNQKPTIDIQESNKKFLPQIHIDVLEKPAAKVNFELQSLQLQDHKGNTPLHYAFHIKDESKVKKMLKNGAELFAKNENGHTPIQMADKSFQTKLFGEKTGILKVKLWQTLSPQERSNLLDLLPPPHRAMMEKVFLNDKTPLDLSLFNKKTLNQKDFLGNTPLHYLDYFENSLPEGSRKALENIGAIPVPNYKNKLPQLKFSHAKNILIEAIKNGDDIVPIIDSKDFPRHLLNERDNLGKTPLIYAIEHGDVSAAKYLISQGANPNTVDLNGNSALYYAAKKKDKNMMELLIDEGGNPYRKNKEGISVYELPEKPLKGMLKHPVLDKLTAKEILEAIRMHGDVNKMTYLHASLLPHNLESKLFSTLLERPEIDVNKRISQTKATPLHEAVTLDKRYVEELVNAGAKLNLRTTDGNTPLMKAIKTKHYSNAEYLLEFKADPSLVDFYKRNPLHALMTNMEDGTSLETVKPLFEKLIKNGKLINAKDITGRTPFDYASPSMRRELLKYGFKSGNAAIGDRVPVFLNLYRSDLVGEKIAKVTNSLKPITKTGIYHGSIEIGMGDKYEVHYYGEVSKDVGADIMGTKYTRDFEEKIPIAYVQKSQIGKLDSIIDASVEELKAKFHGDSYDKLRINCNEFTVALNKKIIDSKMGGIEWIRNYDSNPGLKITRVGAKLDDLLRRLSIRKRKNIDISNKPVVSPIRQPSKFSSFSGVKSKFWPKTVILA